MANRDVFSKVLPNINLTTKLDADGNEVQVERREDTEQITKEQDIYDILVAAGYFRARIKGLSSFDKIVGGMTWCIESCDFYVDVDFDLLFHENLTIGQKISLTEKIVILLPQMKCPFLIEPHQIQGLDFISIFPVIQWLVKRSVENRAAKAERLKEFAIGEFHNHLQLQCDKEHLEKLKSATLKIKNIMEKITPRRQYKRKEPGNEDEKTRVRITLLEYGDKSGAATSFAPKTVIKKSKNNTEPSPAAVPSTSKLEENLSEKEIDVDRLLKNLYVANEESSAGLQLIQTENDKIALQKHYADLKYEMEIDTEELSEQGQIKAAEATQLALERKLARVEAENEEFEEEYRKMELKVKELEETEAKLKSEIAEFEKIEQQHDPIIVEKFHALIQKHEQSKQEEIQYKEECRQKLAILEQELKDAEKENEEMEAMDTAEELEKERENVKQLRLQLAKKNRSISSIQRQLDNIPDQVELAQYQRRFLELYNEVSAKHRETKQYYTLYNSLDDTKLYMEKELTLLNSIYENYNEGMATPSSREEFMNQFETIVEGVKQTKEKVQKKCDDEKSKRDTLNAELMVLIDKQRKYAVSVGQLAKECQRLDALQNELKSLEEAEAAATAAAMKSN